MLYNIKLVVAYEGTRYLGWQKTHDGPTIEGALCKALSTALCVPFLELQAASRTDAGVHAQGQVVNFLLEKNPADFGKLRHSLNALLPKDIVIKEISLADNSFHPTIDCLEKEYHYRVGIKNILTPHRRFFCWHRPQPSAIDLKELNQVAQQLVGTHDFAAFVNLRSYMPYSSTVREIKKIDITQSCEEELCFIICGPHFMYKMVRNIVGTLVYIMEKKLSSDILPKIIESKSRPFAGITAPAHGLCLHNITYSNS